MGANKSAADTLLRQWRMLRAIPRFPTKITASRLHEVLEAAGYKVSKRTVERDLLELSDEFPLEVDDAERPYGWRWARDAPVFDVPNLTNEQAVAFAMVESYLRPLLPAALLEQLKPHFKLARKHLADGATEHGARSWLSKIAAEPPNQPLVPPHIDPAAQKAVTDALLLNRQVRIKYLRRGDPSPHDYTLNPLGLVQRGPITYIVGTLFGYADLRTFALHRVRHAEFLDRPAKRPRNFALETYLATGALQFGSGKAVALDVVFDADAAEHLHETPLTKDQQLTPIDSKHVRLQATVLDTPQLRWWLRAFGDNVEVKGPESLRKEFAAIAAAMAKTYAGTAVP